MTEIIGKSDKISDDRTFQAIWSCYLCTTLAGLLSIDVQNDDPATFIRLARDALANLDAAIASGHPPPSILAETEALRSRAKHVLDTLSSPAVRNPRRLRKLQQEKIEKLQAFYNKQMAPWLLETGVGRFYKCDLWQQDAFVRLQEKLRALPEEQRRELDAKLLAQPTTPNEYDSGRAADPTDVCFQRLASNPKSAMTVFPPPFRSVVWEGDGKIKLRVPLSEAIAKANASMAASYLFDGVLGRNPTALPSLMETVAWDILRYKGVRRLNPGSIYVLLPNPEAICDAATRERGVGTELFDLAEIPTPAALSYFRLRTSLTNQFVVAAVYARLWEAVALLMRQLEMRAKGLPLDPALVLLSDMEPFEPPLGDGLVFRHLGRTFTINDRVVKAGIDIATSIYAPERQSYFISMLSLLNAIRLPALTNTKAVGEYLGLASMFAYFARERGDHIVAGRPARDMVQPDGSILLPYEPQPIDPVMESWGLPLHPDAKVPLPEHVRDPDEPWTEEEEKAFGVEPWDIEDILDLAEPDEDQIQPDPPHEPTEREMLRVSVELTGDPAASLERARTLFLDWIAERTGGELPAEARLGKDFESLHTGQTCVAVRAVGDGADQWAVRAERQDPRQAQRTWGVEAILTLRGGLANLTTRSFVRATRPVHPEPGTPSLLQTLAKEGLLVSGGRSLDGKPISVSAAADAEKLLQLILDPDRRLPVVTIIKSADTGATRTDPAALARSTVGAAFVAVLDPPFAEWLSERLGKGLGVFGDSTRIYMPGLKKGDETSRHPLYYSSREDANPYLASMIRRQLADDSLRRLHPGRDIPTFSDVRQRGLELLRARLSAMNAGVPEQLEAALLEIDGLRRQLSEQDEIAELAMAEHERLEERALQAESLNLAANHRIAELEKRLVSLGEAIDDENDVPVTWDDFADWCDMHLAGRLVLTPQAKRQVRKAQYNDIATAAKSLTWLATTYRERRIDGGEGSLRGPLMIEGLEGIKNDRCGSDAWQDTWRGQPLEIIWHLKNIGSTRDPTRCLRIYYGWDETTQQVVVASMPDHVVNENS
jgi:hypothetical protein